MFNIGPAEMIVILVIALIVFGPKRLPEIGRTVGKSLREFRRASQDLKNEFQGSLEDEDEDEAATRDRAVSGPAKLSGSPETETASSPDGSPTSRPDGSAPSA